MIHRKFTVYSKSSLGKKNIYSFWVNESGEISERDEGSDLDDLLISFSSGEDLICEQTDTEDDGE